MSTVLTVENLNVCYRTASGTVRAANGVDFCIPRIKICFVKTKGFLIRM